jgi:hypothetical protein
MSQMNRAYFFLDFLAAFLVFFAAFLAFFAIAITSFQIVRGYIAIKIG